MNIDDTPAPSEAAERRRAIIRGLAFAVELSNVFQGGVLLRDAEGFPGRKYFLAHAARELQTKLDSHVKDFGLEDASKNSRSGISRSDAKRWVSEVSPKLDSFGDTEPASAAVVEIPLLIVRSLDRHMRREAAVPELVFDRMMRNFNPVRSFLPGETLASLVQALRDIEPVEYCHVRSRDKTVSDSEVVTLWDQLETVLFDLIGSPAWAYSTLDETIDALNRL